MANPPPTGAIESEAKPASRARINSMRAVYPPAASPDSSPAQRAPARVPGRGLQVPPDIAQDYVQVGRDYHLHDGTRAFTVHESALTTKLDDAETMRTLVAVMKHSGVPQIKISGTKAFRQEAWRAASEAGLKVDGYRPSKFEQAKYLPDANTMAPLTTLDGPQRRESSNPTSIPPASTEAQLAQSAPSSPLLSGQLIAHGRTPSSGPDGRASYFVTVATHQGQRTVEDADLERAFAESRTKPQLGNTIGVRAVPKDQLYTDVEALMRGESPPPSNDKHWIVEKREYFSAREDMAAKFRDRDLSPSQVLPNYPELVGAYGVLLVVAYNAVRYEDSPMACRQWVNGIRDGLADRIARGDPMPQLPLDKTLKPAVLKERDGIERDPLVRH